MDTETHQNKAIEIIVVMLSCRSILFSSLPMQMKRQ